MHEGKKVKCNLCEASIDKPYLKLHIAAVHEGKKPFECTECEKRFGNSSSLMTHIKSVHKKNKSLNCPIPADLDAKMPYNCAKCKIQFQRKQHLIIHNALRHCLVILKKLPLGRTFE